MIRLATLVVVLACLAAPLSAQAGLGAGAQAASLAPVPLLPSPAIGINLTSPPPDQEVFGGLVHESLGHASLTLDAQGHLVVSNIGASGNDGVRVDLHGWEGWDFKANPISLPSIGSSMQWRAFGTNMAGTETQGAGVRFTRVDASHVLLEAGIDGCTTLQVNGYRNGLHVYDSQLAPTSTDFIWIIIGIIILDNADGHFNHTPAGNDWGVTWNESTTISLGNGGHVTVDELHVSACSTATPYLNVTRAEIVGANMPGLTLLSESARLFGHKHTALGPVLLSASGGTVVASNAGSSGNGGVAISLGEASGTTLKWADLQAGGPPPATATLRAAATGTLGALTGQPLGSLTVSASGITPGELMVTQDYSPIGSPSQTLVVKKNGVVVASLPGTTAQQVAFFPRFPDYCGKSSPGLLSGPTTLCEFFCWGSALLIRLSNGSTVLGDELAVLADGASAQVNAIEGFAITTADLPNLVLNTETTLPVACTDFGGGLMGAAGLPFLKGLGPLVPGSTLTLSLANAPPLVPALLFTSLTSTSVPFKGGALLAAPPLLQVSLVTSAGGTLALPAAWPAGLGGLTFYFQAVMHDPTAPFGVSVSNAIKAQVP